MSLIPKNIYRTAPFLHPKLEELYLNTESENPDWKIKFYNDKDCINFLENEFSKDNLELKKNVLNSYNKLIPSAYKADLWRLCVIYEYGGVYSDASQIFKIPIDEIIDTTKEFCIIKDKTYNRKQGLQIGLFSSIKKHPFLLKYIEEINNNVQNRTYGVNPIQVTGPGLAYNVANKYEFLDKIKIIGKQSSCREYTNNDDIVIVQKADFHLDVVYNKVRNQHYSYLWKARKIYKIDDENKSQQKQKINSPLIKNQSNLKENKSQQKQKINSPLIKNQSNLKKNTALNKKQSNLKKNTALNKKQTIIKKKNKIRRINNLNYNKNNKLIGYDDSTNHLFSFLKRK